MDKKKLYGAQAIPSVRSLPKSFPKPKEQPKAQRNKVPPSSSLRELLFQEKKKLIDIAKKGNFSRDPSFNFDEYLQEDSFLKDIFDGIDKMNLKLDKVLQSDRVSDRIKKLVSANKKLWNSPFRERNGNFGIDLEFRRRHTEETVREIIKEQSPSAKEEGDVEQMAQAFADMAENYSTRFLLKLKETNDIESMESILRLASIKDEEQIIAFFKPYMKRRCSSFFIRIKGLSDENMEKSEAFLEKFFRELLRRILKKKYNYEKGPKGLFGKTVGADIEEEDEDFEERESKVENNWNYLIIIIMFLTLLFGIYRMPPKLGSGVPQDFKLDKVKKKFGFDDMEISSIEEMALSFYDKCMSPPLTAITGSAPEGITSNFDPSSHTGEYWFADCVVTAMELIKQTKDTDPFAISMEDIYGSDLGIDSPLRKKDPRELYSLEDMNKLNLALIAQFSEIELDERRRQIQAQTHGGLSLTKGQYIVKVKAIGSEEEKKKNNKVALEINQQARDLSSDLAVYTYYDTVWKAAPLTPLAFSGTITTFELLFGASSVVPTTWPITAGIATLTGAYYGIPWVYELAFPEYEEAVKQAKMSLTDENVESTLKKFKPGLSQRMNRFGVEEIGENLYRYQFLNQEVQIETESLLRLMARDENEAFELFFDGYNTLTEVTKDLFTRYILSSHNDELGITGNVLREQRLNQELQDMLEFNGIANGYHLRKDIMDQIDLSSLPWGVGQFVMDFFEGSLNFVSQPISVKLHDIQSGIMERIRQWKYPEFIKESYSIDVTLTVSRITKILEAAAYEYMYLVAFSNIFYPIVERTLPYELSVPIGQFYSLYTRVTFMLTELDISIWINNWLTGWADGIAYSYTDYKQWSGYLFKVAASAAIFAATSKLGNAGSTLARQFVSSIPVYKDQGRQNFIEKVKNNALSFVINLTPFSIINSLKGKQVEFGLVRRIFGYLEDQLDLIEKDKVNFPGPYEKSDELLKRIEVLVEKNRGISKNFVMTKSYVERFFDSSKNGNVDMRIDREKSALVVIAFLIASESKLVPPDFASKKEGSPEFKYFDWLSNIKVRGMPLNDGMVEGIINQEKIDRTTSMPTTVLWNLWERVPLQDFFGWTSLRSSPEKRRTLGLIAVMFIVGHQILKIPELPLNPLGGFITKFDAWKINQTVVSRNLMNENPILGQEKPEELYGQMVAYTSEVYNEYYPWAEQTKAFRPASIPDQPWELDYSLSSAAIRIPMDSLDRDKVTKTIIDAVEGKKFSSKDFLSDWSSKLKLTPRILDTFYKYWSDLRGQRNRVLSSEQMDKYNNFISFFFNPNRRLFESSHFAKFSIENGDEDIRKFKNLLLSVDKEREKDYIKRVLANRLDAVVLRQKIALEEIIEWRKDNPNKELVAFYDDRFYFDETLIGYFNQQLVEGEEEKLPKDFVALTIEEKDEIFRKAAYRPERFEQALVKFELRTK